MNKTILGLLIAVCILGMALIMLNERLTGQTPPISTKEQELTTNPSNEIMRPVEKLQTTKPIEEEPKAQIATPEKPKAQTVTPEKPKAQPVTPEKPKAPVASAEKPKPVQPVAEKPKKEEPKRQEKPQEEKTPDKKKKEEKGKPEKTASEEKSKPSIQKFVVFVREKGATVRIQGSEKLSYKTLQMHDPERFLIVLNGAWNVEVPELPKNPIVSNIRLGREANRTRIVIDFKELPKNARIVNKDDQTIDLRVDQ